MSDLFDSGQRHERVTLETPRHRITGVLTLPRDGYRSRVTDWLNADREFLPLTDVEVVGLDDGNTVHHDFLAVSRRHVVLLMALGGDGQPQA